jgi:hypothetical protein
MSWRSRLAILMVIAHLSAVICGASYFAPSAIPAGRTYRWYAEISGAGSSFGFFAPRVGARHRARFVLEDQQGGTWEEALDETGNPETRLRVTGLIEDPFMSGRATERPEMRGRLIRSWAATMFTRHPAAASVTIEVEAYDIPRIEDYRAGARPRWVKVYQARVHRHTADKGANNAS